MAEYKKVNPFIGAPLVPGNVNLYAQPKVKNKDGSISTVDSVSFNFGGREVLLPTVTPDGRHLKNDDEIVEEFRKTGRHLGQFASVEDADRAARQLHDDYARGRYMGPTETINPYEGQVNKVNLQGLVESARMRAAYMAAMEDERRKEAMLRARQAEMAAAEREFQAGKLSRAEIDYQRAMGTDSPHGERIPRLNQGFKEQAAEIASDLQPTRLPPPWMPQAYHIDELGRTQAMSADEIKLSAGFEQHVEDMEAMRAAEEWAARDAAERRRPRRELEMEAERARQAAAQFGMI